ncbi:hypothetical protein ACJJTC_002436 [Scirpophaga incertulas]
MDFPPLKKIKCDYNELTNGAAASVEGDIQIGQTTFGGDVVAVKSDIRTEQTTFGGDVVAVKTDIQTEQTACGGEGVAVKSDILTEQTTCGGDVVAVKSDIETEQVTFGEDVSNDSNFDNYVTPEELQKLKEFKVLDEVKADDNDSNDEMSQSSDELPEDEIEEMLDENLPDDFKAKPQPKEKAYTTRHKVVLDEKGMNHLEVLPLDWMIVRHYSGMPIYMHRPTRVCTLSKPYFLGKGNTRRHDIPITSIPCLAYRRAIEEEKKQEEIDRLTEEEIKKGTWANLVTKLEQPVNTQNDGNLNESDSNKLVKTCPYSRSNITHIHSDNSMQCPVAGNFGLFNMGETSKESTMVKNWDEQNKTANNSNEDVGASNNSNNESSQGNADDVVFKVPEVPKSFIKSKSTEAGKNDGAANDRPKIRQPVLLPGGIVMPSPKVENINTSWKTQQLTHEEINNYCKKLFQFKTVKVMHFFRWADRRKYTKARKTLQYPAMPDGTKLITIPMRSDGQDNGSKSTKRDWVMNMDGRSYLSVFHEYVWRALHKQPVYDFVQLGGMQYGVGRGSSKRQAKAAAARASIRILIPGVSDSLDAASDSPSTNASTNEKDFSFFDEVKIEDPRIAEFCAATCEPSPHSILRTCLLRNFGANDRHISIEMKKLEFQKIELTMKVGKHEAKVICKNKKTAKQRASQAILQALHPHVQSWGSLLRLYGSRSVKSCKQRSEEQQITLLQDRAAHNRPNQAVLDKLRAEMLQLAARDREIVPIGESTAAGLTSDRLPCTKEVLPKTGHFNHRTSLIRRACSEFKVRSLIHLEGAGQVNLMLQPKGGGGGGSAIASAPHPAKAACQASRTPGRPPLYRAASLSDLRAERHVSSGRSSAHALWCQPQQYGHVTRRRCPGNLENRLHLVRRVLLTRRWGGAQGLYAAL